MTVLHCGARDDDNVTKANLKSLQKQIESCEVIIIFQFLVEGVLMLFVAVLGIISNSVSFLLFFQRFQRTFHR